MSTFQNLALGVIAYNTRQSSKNAEAAATALQTLLENQQAQLEEDRSQQELRDITFNTKILITECCETLNPEQLLFYSRHLLTLLDIEGVVPDRAIEISDKQQILDLRNLLQQITDESYALIKREDRPGRPSADEILDSVRTYFATAVTWRLVQLAQLRRSVIEATKSQQSAISKQHRLMAIVGALIALTWGVFGMNAHNAADGLGQLIGCWLCSAVPLIIAGGWLARNMDLYRPKNWHEIERQAEQLGLSITREVRAPDIERVITATEDDLAAFGEETRDWDDYIHTHKRQVESFQRIDEAIGTNMVSGNKHMISD